MNNLIYILRSYKRDGTHYTHEYLDAYWAWDDLRTAASPTCIDMYTRVELVEFNKEEQQEYPLAELTFPV